jgi:RNA polymerase sigma-70 factor (ECF subfamily)
METPKRTEPAPADEELMAAVKSRDQGALELLYRRYAALVYGIAARSLGAEASEDLLQEVFLAVWTKADSFDPRRGDLRPWLLQIAHFKILNELRRARRRPKVRSGEDGGILESLPATETDAADELWNNYRKRAMREAIDLLPSHQREALSLAYFEDLSQAQIARALRLPLGTVKTRIRAATRRLQVLLLPILSLALVLTISGLGIARTLAAQRERLVARRLLGMATASDLRIIHVPAAAGRPSEEHGSYRSEPGETLGVLAMHELPPAQPGTAYRAWLRYGTRWIGLFGLPPDVEGNGLAYGDDPALVDAPDEIVVTLEESGARRTEPSGTPILRWLVP